MIKRVFIWGMGKYGTLLLDSIKTEFCEVLGIIDCDKKKQGVCWRGQVEVVSPECLKAMDYDYVLISIKNYEPVLTQCNELNISSTKILVLHRDWKGMDFIDSKMKIILELEQKIGILEWRDDLRWGNAPYEFGAYKVPVIKSSEELLERIIQERKSLCRFGDGELELMRGKARPWFQRVNAELAERLKEVFYSDEKEVLIAVSNNFGSLDSYTQSAADEIRMYLAEGGTRAEVMELLGTEREYYDAYVSRPYLMYRDKNHAKKIFGLLKKLWDKRSVLLVEGEYVRTGIGNDLFQNAAKLRRILCPHEDAFDKYLEILECIKENARPEDLVLLCLGPTATVLAYDVCQQGIQAIDIGQIDNEYEWFLKAATKRAGIDGKAVPELEDQHLPDECADEEYIKQIIARI